jgi:hypothetical protein
MLAEYASPYQDTSQTRKRVPSLMNKTIKKQPEVEPESATPPKTIEMDNAGDGLPAFQPLAYPEMPSLKPASAKPVAPSTNPGTVGNYHQVYVAPPSWLPKEERVRAQGSERGEDRIWERLSYITHLLEEQQNERTENVLEEYLLYVLLGTFVIFVVDSFSRSRHYYTR